MKKKNSRVIQPPKTTALQRYTLAHWIPWLYWSLARLDAYISYSSLQPSWVQLNQIWFVGQSFASTKFHCMVTFPLKGVGNYHFCCSDFLSLSDLDMAVFETSLDPVHDIRRTQYFTFWSTSSFPSRTMAYFSSLRPALQPRHPQLEFAPPDDNTYRPIKWPRFLIIMHDFLSLLREPFK